MTTTYSTATLPACPKCKAPAKHALERRNNDGALVGVRYSCSNVIDCDHVWNDPPLPKDTEAKPKPQHAWAHNLPLSGPTSLTTITAPRVKQQRYTPVGPKQPKQAKPKRVLAERTCKGCGTIYTPSRRDALYCSPSCRNGSLNAARCAPRTERPCDRCGTVYLPKKGTNRFCSQECQVQARIRRKAEARGPRPLCLNCQQPFRRRAVDHVYCSPACKAIGKPKRVVRAQLSLTERTCERPGCGKPYVPQRTDQRFCSQKCLRTDSNDKRATWLTCPQCGERFRRRTSRHVWCTPACRDAAKAAEQADPGPTVAPAIVASSAPTPTRDLCAVDDVAPTPSLTATLEALRAGYAAALAACDVLLALERGAQ